MSYKIVEKAVMPNGTEIQLEDWRESNSKEYPDLYGFMIGAYPIARNTSRSEIIQKRDKFRLSISHNTQQNYTNEDVIADFEALKSGQKTLKDLSEHFWYGKRDMFYLGMIDYEVNY